MPSLAFFLPTVAPDIADSLVAWDLACIIIAGPVATSVQLSHPDAICMPSRSSIAQYFVHARAWAQACLPIRMRGLGIVNSSGSGEAAFVES